ncbi:MAG: lysoplasmalogenase [Saprospiraceae bacterium]
MAEYLDHTLLIYFSKPLLMVSLASFYFWSTKNNQKPFDRTILFALAFSCLGDILLLFVEQQSQGMLFFAAGLGSFLLAHLAYIYSFWIFPPSKKIQVSLPIILFFLILAASLLAFLWSGIPPDLKIPVSIYALTICSMGIMSFGMRKKVSSEAGLYLIAGALCFILSDSLIAINKFHPTLELWQPRVSIMLTYLLAQWLIVRGVIIGRALVA